MLSLRRNLEQGSNGSNQKQNNTRISIRDKLLIREIQELEQNLPKSCVIHFEDPNKLHILKLFVSPDEGYWKGGRFIFTIEVPEEYNIVPPKVLCNTKLWHPNISETGDVCLSLLRQNSFDGLGWAPTRKILDVVWGLNSLFTDLLNFEDPLNVEAAEHFLRDKESFISKVHDYIRRHAKR